MENQTRFDLNAAIESWRNELATQSNLASDDRRELETHLRDAIAGFQQRGLNDEESFWLARRRVGQPEQLGEEFVKADPAKVWRERVFWMATGVVSAWLLSLFIYNTESILGRFIPAWGRFNVQVSSWIEPLQVSIIAALFASGRLSNLARQFQWFFGDRLRFGVLVLSLTVFASLLSVIGLELNAASTGGNIWALIWNVVFKNLVLASSYFLLLVWLLPTRSSRDLNCA
jgi:hypothetical protein